MLQAAQRCLTRGLLLPPAAVARAVGGSVAWHLASVAAELPAAVLGAAFVAELPRAVKAAALGDHPTLTGKTIELFSRLHKRGFLASVPADQAALKLLAERTPLVRQLHYRRWCAARTKIAKGEQLSFKL